MTLQEILSADWKPHPIYTYWKLVPRMYAEQLTAVLLMAGSCIGTVTSEKGRVLVHSPDKIYSTVIHYRWGWAGVLDEDLCCVHVARIQELLGGLLNDLTGDT